MASENKTAETCPKKESSVQGNSQAPPAPSAPPPPPASQAPQAEVQSEDKIECNRCRQKKTEPSKEADTPESRSSDPQCPEDPCPCRDPK